MIGWLVVATACRGNHAFPFVPPEDLSSGFGGNGGLVLGAVDLVLDDVDGVNLVSDGDEFGLGDNGVRFVAFVCSMLGFSDSVNWVVPAHPHANPNNTIRAHFSFMDTPLSPSHSYSGRGGILSIFFA
ncbi:hypothetical protein [Paenibacillus swuensis]|uniref:hypothetical protein n=1 Tax=Paenibacillus swuensis TaxID=1178515 RepID=UPI0018D43CBF|nr:hypothetical protein [Paenibacillus swuensis]